MPKRTVASALALLLFLAAGLPAQSRTFPVDELRAGMIGIGKTVFEGDRLDEFKVHILGVLRNVIGTRRNLILARLEGGPLANTGVIAGMSGSPVYIDGRLLGAVSYSLGQFSKEPIAGITPIDEMTEAATFAGPRRQAARVELQMPLTPESLRTSLRQAFTWMRPFADSPADVQVFGGAGLNAGIGTLLRPIATPLTLGGFDAGVIDPVASAFSDQGFVPVMAGSSLLPSGLAQSAGTAVQRHAVETGRSGRCGPHERRPGIRRHRHGHRHRRQPRLCVRSSVLRSGPHAVPHDQSARPHGPPKPGEFDEDRQHG